MHLHLLRVDVKNKWRYEMFLPTLKLCTEVDETKQDKHSEKYSRTWCVKWISCCIFCIIVFIFMITASIILESTLRFKTSPCAVANEASSSGKRSAAICFTGCSSPWQNLWVSTLELVVGMVASVSLSDTPALGAECLGVCFGGADSIEMQIGNMENKGQLWD